VPNQLFISKFFVVIGLFLHIFAPLLFFTQLTQNPYSIQILIVQSAVLVSLLFFGVFMWNEKGPIDFRQTTIDIPILVLALWALMTWGLSYFHHGLFFRSGIFHEGLRGMIFLWVNGIGVFFLSTQTEPQGPARALRRLMMFVAALSATYAIFQYFGVDPLWGEKINPFAGRPVSTYGNPNFLSSALVLLLPLTLHECFTASTKQKAMGWIGLSWVYTAALTATMTRSSWLGIGMGLALYVFLDRTTIGRFKIRAIAWEEERGSLPFSGRLPPWVRPGPWHDWGNCGPG
jgi:hypothetical protein